jgi:hypothetical protein
LRSKIYLDRMSDGGWGMQDLADGAMFVRSIQLVGVKMQDLGRGSDGNQRQAEQNQASGKHT